MISSTSDTAAEEQPSEVAGNTSSSNEWGACRLRQRRSTSRIPNLATNVAASKSASPASSTSRQTRSSDSMIQSPPPPPLPITPTSSASTAPALTDVGPASVKEQPIISDEKNDEVPRPAAVRFLHTLNLTIFKFS